jgi:glutamyl-tRNA reductase
METHSVDLIAADTCHEFSDPVIVQFRTALKEIQTRELKRLYDRLPQLDTNSKEAIKESADCIVERVLRAPTESLRDNSSNHHELLPALRRLFQLDE